MNRLVRNLDLSVSCFVFLGALNTANPLSAQDNPINNSGFVTNQIQSGVPSGYVIPYQPINPNAQPMVVDAVNGSGWRNGRSFWRRGPIQNTNGVGNNSSPPSMSNTPFSNRWRADLKVSGRGFRP